MLTITKENLIENLNNLGSWSHWHLATIALYYYADIDSNEITTHDEMMLMKELGFNCTGDIIIKYHQEIGYKDFQLNINVVNKY